MSIADKLTYLQTTKQLLKTEINKINNVLDDNSTFRSYPQELFNGYLDVLNNGTDTLWSNLEKVSASGEEATLENVETAPIKMVLNGNTSQDTTSGKNLFDKSSNIVLNKYIGEDGAISGNSPRNWYQEDYIEVSNSTDYIISTTSSNYVRVAFYDDSKNFISRIVANGGIQISTTSSTKYLRLSGYDNLNDNIQLELGSTATSWEPYTGGQPSPSPDYPQEVKVVKGENVVSVQGKNLLNPSVARYNCNVNNDTGIITITTNATDVYIQGAYAYSEANKFLTLPSGNYYLKSTNPNVKITFYGDIASLNTSSQQPQKLNSETNFGGIRIRSNSSLQNVSFGILLSTTDDTYVPYSKTDYPINLGDIELCKINTYKDYFHKDSGKWYVHKEINKIILDGTNVKFTYQEQSSLPNRLMIPASSRPRGLESSNLVKTTHFKVVGNTVPNTTGLGWYTSTQMWIYKDGFTSLAVGNNWLSNNNVTLYYVLIAPTEEEITNTTLISQLEAISKAKSVKDKTYITQTNDELPFILDVEAIKEYEVN